MQVALLILAGIAVLILGFFAFMFWEKNKISTGVQLQCSSGDSEVMIFNTNFLRGESDESRNSKLSELWQKIQDRRDENHEKFLAVKADAMKENEEKLKNGEELKLRSITEVSQ